MTWAAEYGVRWTPLHVHERDTTKVNLPDNGREVIVITPGGDERELYYENGLWFLPDRSMYVYFTPVFWRYK